jgi:multiple sugar transport system substrate-binding protein
MEARGKKGDAQPVARRAVLGGAALGAAALAACRPGGPGAASPPAAAREPVTLRLSWLTTKDEYTMAERGPVFEQRFPNLKLQFEPVADYMVKLAVMFNSDTIGDVMFLEADDEDYFGYWASQGVLTQLDPYVKRDKVDQSVFFPRASEALRSVDGNLWCYHFKAFMARCGLVYNSALFQSGGVAPPTDDWTYDDLAGAAKRLTPAGGAEADRWGGGRLLSGDVSLMAALRAFGGDVYSPDGKRTLIASEGSRRAVSWWLDRHLVDRSVALEPASNPQTLFTQGKAAMLMGYNPNNRATIANALNPAGVPWGLVLMPKGPSGRRGGSFFVQPTGLAKVSKHKDEAWELQKFLAEKETAIVAGLPTPTSGQSSAIFGPRADAYADPRVLAAPGMPPGVMAACLRAMDLAEPFTPAWNFRSADVRDVLNTEMTKAVRGQVQADGGFFGNVERLIQVVLDQPKRSTT